MDEFINVSEAISLAIRREEEAYQFYTQMMIGLENERLKKLLEFLAGEETKHKQRLEDQRDTNLWKEM